MKFHPTGTDPTRDALLVCRNTRWGVVMLLAVLWAAPIFWWYVAAPWWVTALCAALPALLTLPMFGIWRRRGRADNWVLALYRDGIWLNLRDCDYHLAEPAKTVVFIPYAEVGAARRFIHRYTTPSSDHGSTSRKDSYLELQLSTPDTGELQRVLDEERRRDPPQRSHLGGFVTSRTRRTQAPIELEDDGTLRVKFRMLNYWLTPSLKKVLKALQQFVTIEADHVPIRADWTTIDGLEFDELVRHLVRNGARIDAMELLRRRKGFSTTEAKQFVDKLSEDLTSEPVRDASGI